ncbi:sensor histidine kinase [Parasediminibacterium sp. JCM 36343]|uniref:sensor histidine kinase n=1 Tax=Parasediminibacterium sp. JCM 36343 TaxID=3374279 RepID=UPI003978F574
MTVRLSMRQKLTMVTIVYWVLLSYMIAALVWWFIALQNQNSLMASMRLVELKKDDPHYIEKVTLIEDARGRKIAQYIGEGSTFLALIIVGAVFVFRATRRQLMLSQQQQNFMMAVTHELKTPIAVAMLNLETLQKRKLDIDKQQKLIGNTLQEANRLNTLCNNILFAAQLDAGAYKPSQVEINWSNIVANCAKDFINRYPNRNIPVNITDGLHIMGEELLLQMLVNNLIENALKYTPKEASVAISLQAEGNKMLLQVADEGIGIAEEEKKRVFEKFYRSGDEKLRNTKGTGLGLYLCKKIVQGHKGTIAVSNNQPKGSIFTVIFNGLF